MYGTSRDFVIYILRKNEKKRVRTVPYRELCEEFSDTVVRSRGRHVCRPDMRGMTSAAPAATRLSLMTTRLPKYIF